VRTIKKAEQQKVKRMNLNVPIELHNSFKAIVSARGQKMTDILLDFIQSYVAKYSQEPKVRRK
jgi:hypothetical protein